MRLFTGLSTQLALLGSLLLLSLQPGGATPRTQAPIEHVSVDLILVDVEARDAQGKPLRNLKASDFDVRLGGLRRTIYSVDDRCGCNDTSPTTPANVAGGTPPEGHGTAGESSNDRPALTSPAASPATSSSAPGEPFQLVFYFDFGLMDLDGRNIAFNEARRWIRETMRDGDQVMIVGSTFAGGAVVVAEMTNDKRRLLAAIDVMKEGKEFIDPHTSFLPSRIEDCENDWRTQPPRSLPNCNFGAFSEYEHTRGTLKALTHFMDTLDLIEGRKQMVFLHQVAPFRPVELYPGARLTATHALHVEELGAAAVAAHVTIHAASTEDSTTIGELAAEFTGGSYNRGVGGLSSMLDAVRNRCECLYRIGIEPLENEKGHIGEVTVRVRNRTVANLRVKIRSSSDQWLRKARRVLHNPGAARDLPVSAALLPVTATKNTWTVKVQVALHSSALTRLPVSGGSRAEWEAGARLELDGGKRTWDLLAVSSMNASSASTAPAWIVHEQTLADLPPGNYRLNAFVRDRSADLFGGASSILDLPDPGKVGAIGPIPLLAERRLLTSDLPLQPAASAGMSRGRIESAGLVPAGDTMQGDESGAPFEIMTWLCGVAALPASPPAAERYLSFENAVVMSFPAETEWTPAGTCVTLSDRVEAGLLDDWPYRYHLRWKDPAGGEPIAVDVALP